MMSNPKQTVTCSICRSSHLVRSVHRNALPIFQNIVYENHDEAVTCPRATLTIGTCEACGFSFNVDFDPGKVVYDARYDNHVESGAFDLYYRQVAKMLVDRYGLNDGTVYDIGCGNGHFLRILCEAAPNIRAIGIDSSCKPLKEDRLELISRPFSAELFDDSARLVICRHVLEHIHRPVDFLSQLRQAMPNAPLYVEVPDLDWIIENNSFWDFCYEHCNYFTVPTLARALSNAGFEIEVQENAFGGQYQWAGVRPAPSERSGVEPADLGGDFRAYAESETGRLCKYAKREVERLETICKFADAKGGIILWGMATKGVILSNLIGAERVRAGIDMNSGKQGKFAPGSGVKINNPSCLSALESESTIVVMNPNYRDEISISLKNRGIHADLVTL